MFNEHNVARTTVIYWYRLYARVPNIRQRVGARALLYKNGREGSYRKRDYI